MKSTILAVLLALQMSEPRAPVTVRLELDTELPLGEVSVSVEEKRELREVPKPREAGGGIVTLRDLPEGNLHLLFYRQSALLGKIVLSSAEKGQFIRIKVRLVDGNAILLDEFRIRGVSDLEEGKEPPVSPRPSSIPPTTSTSSVPAASPAPSRPSTPPTRTPSGQQMPCPNAGEAMTLKGKILRVIDNDSFELQSGPWAYTVYIGSATRIHRGMANIRKDQIKESQPVTVKGTVAAGPEGECSIGAKEIELRR